MGTSVSVPMRTLLKGILVFPGGIIPLFGALLMACALYTDAAVGSLLYDDASRLAAYVQMGWMSLSVVVVALASWWAYFLLEGKTLAADFCIATCVALIIVPSLLLLRI